MHPSPRVTVITPVYNGERYLRATLESVLGQTFQDWEYLLIDDGSRAPCVALARELAAVDPRIRLLEQPNRGKAFACNLGLDEARGEFVAILDQDDLYYPDKLAAQIELLDLHPEAGMVYSNTDVVDGEGNLLDQSYADRYQQRYAVGPAGRRQAVDDSDVWLFPYLVVADCIPMLTHLMRRQAALAVGGFNQECWPSDDWDFWIRFSRRYPIHKINRELTAYRWHGANFSADMAAMGEIRAKIYARLLRDETLSEVERRQVKAAFLADLYEHADRCADWAGEAWGSGSRAGFLRYQVRRAKLTAQATLMRCGIGARGQGH